jgi:hypothetical protein
MTQYLFTYPVVRKKSKAIYPVRENNQTSKGMQVQFYLSCRDIKREVFYFMTLTIPSHIALTADEQNMNMG